MRRAVATTVEAGCRVAAAGLVAFLAGCGAGESDGYEPSFRYPPRVDPVVVRVPASEPVGLPAPGKLDAHIATLPSAGGELADPAELPAADRERLAVWLEQQFGTPAAPLGAGVATAGELDLSADTLAAGSRVFKRNCANCHGLTGDGRGPVGLVLDPYPRDFRAGLFKVAVGASKPTAEQLVRLLQHGVPGTVMPRYDLIPEADVRAVAAYVAHLSLRGEAEAAGVRAGVEGDDPVSAAERALTASLDRWNTPPAMEPHVPATDPAAAGYAEAVRRGRELFGSPAAGCASCHQDYGRTEVFRYGAWGAPGRVRDLTRGELSWGGDDAALAARVRHGIPAAGMPANPHLSDQQVGDLVTFVRDLGLPGRLPPDVRAAVYPQAAGR